MNLYLLEQNTNSGYDTYDSCVVAAKNEAEARKVNPGGFRIWKKGKWYMQFSDGGEDPDKDHTWVDDLDLIKVTFLGIAEPKIMSGVICSSFHAG